MSFADIYRHKSHFESLLLSLVSIDPTTGCWEWNGTKNSNGYGQVYFNGKGCPATRMAAAIWKYFPLIPYLEVCHSCDNPPCINPDHLFIATHAKNMRDCRTKGRMHIVVPPNGERNHLSKLKDADIPTIRKRHIDGDSYYSIGKDYGIGTDNIRLICQKKTWKHIP